MSNYKAYVWNSWVGGQATDKKVGIQYSFADSQSLDFRRSPSQFSVLPGTRRADANIVTDLVQNEVMTEDGTIYAIGSGGNVYAVDDTGVWGLFGSIGDTGTYGISYRKDQDAIYIPGTTAVSVITNVSSSPTLQPSFYGISQSIYDNSTNAGFNVNSDQSSGTSTTLLSTTLSEQTTHLRYWQTDIQPVVRIGVFITTVGTGDWTMVAHDGLNNEIGSDTIANASLSTGWNYFEFTPMEVNVGPNAAQTYHYHLTSTVADGYVRSTSLNDLSTADMELYADRLVETSNGIHPQITFQQYECIGNGRYLSVWENLGEETPSNAAWQRQKLSFPPGYEVCGVAVFNEYLVIATEKTVTGTNTAQDGIIFYWDGLSDTYNYFTKIPEGSPQSIHEYENCIYYTASGNWYIITSVAATPQKIRNLPGAENTYTGDNTQTEVYPYMGTVRHGIHLLGYPSTTANTNLAYGVYSWGQVDYSQPTSFGYSYILSTGSQYVTDTNNLTIGMVKNFGDILHISWRDGSSYGVDIVDAASTPAAYATWESLIVDGGMVTKDKQVSYIEASWLTIQDGVEIVLKYSINRGAWVESPRYSNSNLWGVDEKAGYARLDVGNDDGSIEQRFNELQVAIDVYCDDTVTEAPVVVGVSAIFDPLGNEVLQ